VIDVLCPEITASFGSAFVTSRLDYCNAVLAGLPKSTLAPLERVQKAALSPSAPRSGSLSGLNRAAKESQTEEKAKGVEKDSEDRKGRIELGKISISDEQFKKILQEELRLQLSALELCYQKSSEKQSNFKGEVILKVVIDPRGKVLKVDLISSHLKDTHFEQCLIQKIREMKLSMPGGSNQASTTATFTLKLM
jgi:outer membrane biosynthesis protein TonB